MISKVNSQASVLASQVSPSGDSNQNKINKVETKEVDRVSAIAEQIKNGTYKVDMSKTAKAIAEELS